MQRNTRTFYVGLPPDTTPMIIDHYNNIYDLPEVSLGARASVVGKIRQDGMYVVHNGKEK